MSDETNHQYRKAAEAFARKIVSELGDAIDSIVLYGSVARGDATEESDIDVLIISPDEKVTRDRIYNIAGEFDSETDYAFFISQVHYSRERFYWLRKNGSPFIREVMRDGVILYDNQTYTRVLDDGARFS